MKIDLNRQSPLFSTEISGVKTPSRFVSKSITDGMASLKNQPCNSLSCSLKKIVGSIFSFFRQLLSCFGLFQVSDENLSKDALEKLEAHFVSLLDFVNKNKNRSNFKEDWKNKFDALPTSISDRIIMEDLRSLGRKKIRDKQEIENWAERSFKTHLKERSLRFIRDLVPAKVAGKTYDPIKYLLLHLDANLKQVRELIKK